MTTIAPEQLAQLTADITEDEYIDQVLAAIPLNTPAAVWHTLLSDDLVRRTHRALRLLNIDLEEVLAEAKASMHPASYERWRRTNHLDTQRALKLRLMQVKDALNNYIHRTRPADDKRTRDLACRLAVGIQTHRLATVAAGLGPEPHDRALWALLASETVPFTVDDEELDLTIDEVFGRGFWRVPESIGVAA